MQRFLTSVVLVILLAACSTEKSAPANAVPKTVFGSFGIDTAQMDTSLKPGDDFYGYVNGKWVSTFKIPPDKATYGVFDALIDKSDNDVHALLDELAKTSPAAGSVNKKVIDFYNS